MSVALGLAWVFWATRDGQTTMRGEIVFGRSLQEDGDPSDLYVINADGTALRLLVHHGAFPAASRDGTIAFVRDGAVWLAARDGTGQRQLTHPPASSRGGGGDSEPAWSPEGGRLYFTRAEDRYGDTGLFVIGSNGRGLRRLNYAPPTDHVDCDSRPAVSPNGATVAFAQTGDCEHGFANIVGVTADGKAARLPFRWPSGNDTFYEWGPAWAPDGRLAYSTLDYDALSNPPFGVGGGGLYVSRPDHSSPRRVVKSGDVDSPAWSPDGRWLAYSGFQAGHLYIVAQDGSHLHSLTKLRGYLRYPTWLPPG